jgi:hypothetical protein
MTLHRSSDKELLGAWYQEITLFGYGDTCSPAKLYRPATALNELPEELLGTCNTVVLAL